LWTLAALTYILRRTDWLEFGLYACRIVTRDTSANTEFYTELYYIALERHGFL